MATFAEQAYRLLDFGQQLDIPLLEAVVHCMLSGSDGYEVKYIMVIVIDAFPLVLIIK